MASSGPAAPAAKGSARATETSTRDGSRSSVRTAAPTGPSRPSRKRSADSSRNNHLWESLEPTLALLSPNTRKAYISTIEAFRADLDGGEPTPELARTYFLDLVNRGAQEKSRGLKATSLARHRAALRWLFREVFDRELPRLPRLKQEEREPRYLKLDQVQAVLSACKTPLEKAVVHTLYGAGLRVSELLGLKRDDITPGGYLRIWGKGNRQESVPVPEQVTKALAAHIDGKRRQEVFPFGYSALRAVLNGVADRAKVQRFTPHALRHSYVTHSLMRGAAVQDVSKAVRHRNVQTTMAYTHIADHELKSRLPNLFENEKSD